MWLIWKISLPHLLAHRARTTLTILGIALGVAAMVATTTVTDAAFQAFQHGVEATAGRADLQVTNGSSGVPEEAVETIAGVAGVSAASPLVEGSVALATGEGEVLTVFGLDFLGDQEHEAQIPRSAVDVPDEVLFVAQRTSVALVRSFAARHGLALDGTLPVIGPTGRRDLTVRGLVNPVGPASLFDGAVALMDLPAAQWLLAKEGRVDRVDVRLAPGADREVVKPLIQAILAGRAVVDDAAVHGARAQELLFSVRVMLSIAAMVAIVVGFFLIYHTVSVSVLQRRREMALLTAMGVSRLSVAGWLGAEAVVLGTVSGFVGYAIGLVLAKLSLGSVVTVASAFTRLPDPVVRPSAGIALLAVAVAVMTTLAATLVPTRAILSERTAILLRPSARPATTTWGRSIAWGVIGLTVTVALLALSPRTLPYRTLVAFIFSVNSLPLVSAAAFCPAAAALLGWGLAALAQRGRGISLLLASKAVGRNPRGPVAVVIAIVMGLGWTLADASLIDSFRSSWLGWIDGYYQSDLIVGAGPTTVSFLTGPPFSADVVTAIGREPGVRAVQGQRIVDVTYRGHPIAVQAMDAAPEGLAVQGARWADVAEPFWAGRGVAASQQLAHLEGLAVGDEITLTTPAGQRTFPILAVFADFRVGTLGSVAMSRELYRAIWNDPTINSVRVWAADHDDVPRLRGTIHARFGASQGLQAVTAADFRRAVSDLTENIFALHYTVVLIALLVSLVGVTNFLLASVLDRRAEHRTLAATGVTRWQIGGAIVIEGALLGVVGAAIGLVTGTLVSRIIVEHSVPMVNGWHFDWVFPVTSALRLSAAVIALSALAGLVPARIATRRAVALEVDAQ